jgi:hypothetical protein
VFYRCGLIDEIQRIILSDSYTLPLTVGSFILETHRLRTIAHIRGRREVMKDGQQLSDKTNAQC